MNEEAVKANNNPTPMMIAGSKICKCFLVINNECKVYHRDNFSNRTYRMYLHIFLQYNRPHVVRARIHFGEKGDFPRFVYQDKFFYIFYKWDFFLYRFNSC